MDKMNNIEENNEFEKLQNLLRELPKVGTPDNFEYKLMTRIHNKNFEIKSEKKKNIFFWVYTPALALVASVILIFFVFTDSDVDSENPWNSQPKLLPELQSSETATFNSAQQNDNIQADAREKFSKSLSKEKKNSSDVNASSQSVQPSIQKNGVAANTKAKPVYPFDKSKSVDLDKLLTTEEAVTAPSNGLAQPHLAGQGNAFESPFSGFFIRQREAEARKESLRIREDSLNQLKESEINK